MYYCICRKFTLENVFWQDNFDKLYIERQISRGLSQWLPLASGGGRREAVVGGGRRWERFALSLWRRASPKRSRRLPPPTAASRRPVPTAASKWEPLEQTQLHNFRKSKQFHDEVFPDMVALNFHMEAFPIVALLFRYFVCFDMQSHVHFVSR